MATLTIMEEVKKKRLMVERREATHDVESISDRIRDIEFSMKHMHKSMSQQQYEAYATERRRAIDKLREVRKELLKIELQMIEEGMLCL